MSFKAIVKSWIPPKILWLGRRLKDSLFMADWEYIPQGWNYVSKRIKGWNVEEIVNLQAEKWDLFVENISGQNQIGINHESNDYSSSDLFSHNLIMTYSYVVSLASQKKNQLKILDWGGGIGHYGKITEAVLTIPVEYTCYDLEIFCQKGRYLYPTAKFISETKEVFKSNYNTTVIGSSLWYDREWQQTLNNLTEITEDYLFISRMIFIEKSSSYIAIQRPYSAGYPTEYLCQIFNQNELIQYLENCGFDLVREFFVGHGVHIHKAPEQGDFKSFLFRKSKIREHYGRGQMD